MTVKAIIQLLERKRYSKKNCCFRVGEVDFEFDGVLIGPKEQDVLVLIANSNRVKMALRKTQALSMVLRRSGSNRPFKLILLADNIDESIRMTLERLCHFVIVPTDASTEELNELLYCLFPMDIEIEQQHSQLSVQKTLEQEIKGLVDDSLVKQLLKAAHKSSKDVQDIVLDSISDSASIDI